MGFLGGTSCKESNCRCRRCNRKGFHHSMGKIPWRRKWQPTPVFLPGKSHGQRSTAGPWGCKTVGHDLVTKQQQRVQAAPNKIALNTPCMGDASNTGSWAASPHLLTHSSWDTICLNFRKLDNKCRAALSPTAERKEKIK